MHTTARGASESGTKTDYEPCRQCHPRVVWQLEWNGMENYIEYMMTISYSTLYSVIYI